MKHKVCKTCGVTKPADCFNGKSSKCKHCVSVRRRDYYRDYYAKNRPTICVQHSEWNAKNRETRAAAAKARRLRVNYGLAVEDFHALKQAQEGRCAVCRRATVRLVVDHCHKTGSVRGLLCDTCNRGLGLFFDKPSWLRAAAEYLEQREGEWALTSPLGVGYNGDSE